MFCMAYMWLSLAPRPLPQSSLGTRLTCGYATAVCVHWTMTMYITISMCVQVVVKGWMCTYAMAVKMCDK